MTMTSSEVSGLSSSLMRSRTRVAMFVMNPCQADARVRKEAQALGEAGYEVRVFALGNTTWPKALTHEPGFTIQRLEVVSVYQRLLRGLGRIYRREVWFLRAPAIRRALQVGLLPFALLVVLDVQVGHALRRAGVGLVHGLHRVVARPRSRLDVSAVTHGPRPAGRLRRRLRFRSRLRALSEAGSAAGRRSVQPVELVLARSRRVAAVVRRSGHRVVRAAYLATARFVRRRLIVLHRPSVYAEYWKTAAASATDWEPDVVHAHDLNALPAAVRVAAGRAIPVVYDSHELWRHRNRVTRLHPISRVFDAIQEHRLIRRVDLVITVGGQIESWLQDTYRLPSNRTTVLRNVPWSRGACGPAPALRQLAGLPDARIVLYTGRITSGRGLEEAIDALPSLADDVNLVMLGYGDDEYIESLSKRALRLGALGRLHLIPPVPSEQVPAVASQADVALVAIQPLCLSYRYALPNKLFEAIQAGVPVVASDLPEISAIVRQYGVGKLFQVGDAQELARAVSEILAAPSIYRAGTDVAAVELCWEREREILLKAYGRLAPAEGASAASGPTAVV